MIAILLATLGLASEQDIELFPADTLAEAARSISIEAPSSEGGAVDDASEATSGLSVNEQMWWDKYARRRRTRDASLVLGALSMVAVIGGGGLLTREVRCGQCRPTGALGPGLLIGGIVGVEVGSLMGLVAVNGERRALEELGAGWISTNGVTTGGYLWTSQLLLPGVGAVASYSGIISQAATNDRALSRLTR